MPLEPRLASLTLLGYSGNVQAVKHFRVLFALLVSVGLAAACGDDDGGSSESIESLCQRGCVKSASLNCPNDPSDCAGECVDEFNELPSSCSQQILAYGKCLADSPVSIWECDGDGEASPVDGACEAQLAAAIACAMGGGGAGG